MHDIECSLVGTSYYCILTAIYFVLDIYKRSRASGLCTLYTTECEKYLAKNVG